MGRNLGNPPFATRESLPLIRERELEEACKAIGITDLRKMGLRDKTVEFEPYDQMDQMIQSLIDETASQTGPFLKQLASPEIDGQAQSFLKIEPFWTYHFES
ncbi:Uncharacterized proteins, LmbE homologs [Mycobacteroides abscessus subsp. massiliense]|nr:Uncharacterized proteins, LmbE homologs [Mycobacteroides abscessus subsp. massiliense]